MKTNINKKVDFKAGKVLLNFKSLTLALVTFVSSLLITNPVIGQNATNYTFTTTTNGSLTSATWTTLHAAGIDDAATGIYSMNFPFFFNGSWYNNFTVSSNGLMRLGNTAVTANIYTTTNFPALNSPLIAPYYTDLQAHSTGSVRVVITGTAPNRALIVQWFNMEMNYNSTTADATFECRLYEANGVIEFVYGQMSVGSISTSGGTINDAVIGFCNSNTANNVFTVNQVNYTTNNTSAAAIVNTNTATGAISTLNSSADGSRRVFRFTPDYTFNILSSGNTTWTPPCGVTSIIADAWGAGGGGGNSANTTTNGGTGGGGGAFARGAHTVANGSTYFYSIGTGGNGGLASSTAAPGAGNSTWFSATAANPNPPTSNISGTLAKGGGAGVNNSTTAPTNGATTAASFGNLLTFQGGNGGAGNASGGGGGGASGGSAAGNNGAIGTSTTAGGGLAFGGGNGGSGSGTTNGTAGSNPGGGGGGSNDVASTTGGNGAPGRLCIWYATSKPSVAPTSATASALTGCSGYPTTLTQTGGTLGTGGTWKWYSGSCGGTLVGTSTAADASLTVNVSANTTYYVRSEGACVGGTTACASISVTVTPIPSCISTFTPAAASTQPASGVTLSWGAVSNATSYDIYFGTNASATNIVNGTNTTSTSYSTGALTGGIQYYWKIIPKNSCGSAVGCITYSFTTAAPCTAPTFTATPTNALCVGASNGSISVSASGGTSPFQYSKDNGATWQAGSSFSGLAAGPYLIVVKGNDGCTAAASSTTVSNPTPLTASVTSATLSGCSGSTVSLGGSASGGTGTLTYSWSPATGLSSAAVASPSLTITGSQTYTLTVTDANGCTSNQPTVAVSIGGITKYWAGAGSGMTGATTGTDFNTAANWSSTTGTKTAVSQSPQSCDDAVINLTSGATITLSANSTVNSLNFTTAYNTATPAIFDITTFNLNVTGNYAINMTTGAGASSQIIQRLGNGSTLTIGGNALIGTGPVIDGFVAVEASGQSTSSGNIIFRGNLTFGDGYGTLSQTTFFGTVYYDAPSSQTITVSPTYACGFQSNSVIIGLNNSPTVNLVSSTGTAYILTGNTPTLTLSNSSILNLNATPLIKSTTWVAGGTINLLPNTQLRLSGSTGGQTGNNFPLYFTSYTFDPTSTVEYYGATQTVFATPTYGNLTISTSGTKTAGAGLTLAGNMLINSPATFAAGTSLTHNIGGNWTNNGTFTYTTANTINFNTAGSKTISGSSATAFNNIIINKGTDVTNVMEANGTGAISNNGNITISNGLFKMTTGIFQFNAGPTIPSTGGLWVNGATLNSAAAFSYTNNGWIKISSGSAAFGTSSGNSVFNQSSGAFDISGGTVSIAGRLENSASGAAPSGVPSSGVNITGGTLTLCTVANTAGTGSFNMSASSKLNWTTGGTVIIQNPNTNATPFNDINILAGGTKSITAGTFQIGNASTGISNTFLINSAIPIFNLTINSTNAPKATLAGSLDVNGTLTMNGGNLNIATYNLTLSNAVTNASPSATNMIVADGGGEVRARFTVNGTYLYPIGNGAGTAVYSPISLSVTGSAYSNAYMGVKVNASKHPNNNSTTNFLKRFWTVTPSGITAPVSSVTGTYVAGDINGTQSSISSAQLNGTFNQSTNPWVKYTTLSSNTLSAASAPLTASQASIFTGITGANPTVTISPSSVSICNGSTTALTANPVGDLSPTVSYLWSNSSTTNSITVGGGTYTVVFKDANGISSATSSSVSVTLTTPTIATTPTVGTAVWRGATSTDWTTASNWYAYDGTNYTVATATPISTSNVIIPANQGCVTQQPTVISGTVDANNVTVETGAALTMTTGTLNVAGNFTVNGTGTFTSGTGTVNFTGGNGVTQVVTNGTQSFNHVTINGFGTVKLTSNTTINGNYANNSGSLDMNNFNLTVGGNYANYNSSAGLLPGTGTVNFSGGNGVTQVVTTGNQAFNNVTVSGFSTVQLTGNTTINGNYTNNSGSLDLNNFNLTVGGNYANYNSSAGLLPGTGTVIFNKASGTQTVDQLGLDFNHIQHTGAGTLQLLSDISTTGDIINSAGTFDANDKIITVKNNFTNTATFTPGTGGLGEIYFEKAGGTQTLTPGNAVFQKFAHTGTGTLNLTGTVEVKGNVVIDAPISAGTSTMKLSGTGNQTMSGTQSVIALNSLTVDKTGGTVNLSKPVRVEGALTMTQGNIVTSSSNKLEIGSSTSSLGSVSWTAGNVVGPMRRWFAGATNSTPASGLFPVGLSTVNRYAQVNFTQAPGSGGYIDLEYKAGAPANVANWTYLTTPDGQIIQTFEDEGYWDITPYDASGNAYPSGLNTSAFTMKLRANGLTSVNDISVTRIIRSPGPLHTTWEPAGFHIAATGTSADFAIESNTITGFSWFNIGSPDNNALPVELLNFNGTCNEGMVDLTWQTASEFNSSHFDVEKSTDGETWRVVATIPSAGTSTELLTYQTVDNNGTSGSNYYRLRQVDNDGKEKLYNPINVSCVETTTGYFTSYPNPSGSDFQVVVNDKEILGACTLNIVDAQGKVIDQRTIEVKDGINMFVISEELNPGIYFLNITNGVKTTEVIRHAVK